MPIYGLEQGQTGSIQIADFDGNGLELMNVTAHSYHGSSLADDCANFGTFTMMQNDLHMGQLEYASFNLCDAKCWPDKPNDYCFRVPSSWDSTIV